MHIKYESRACHMAMGFGAGEMREAYVIPKKHTALRFDAPAFLVAQSLQITLLGSAEVRGELSKLEWIWQGQYQRMARLLVDPRRNSA